jgi:hypothetical protein
MDFAQLPSSSIGLQSRSPKKAADVPPNLGLNPASTLFVSPSALSQTDNRERFLESVATTLPITESSIPLSDQSGKPKRIAQSLISAPGSQTARELISSGGLNSKAGPPRLFSLGTSPVEEHEHRQSGAHRLLTSDKSQYYGPYGPLAGWSIGKPQGFNRVESSGSTGESITEYSGSIGNQRTTSSTRSELA